MSGTYYSTVYLTNFGAQNPFMVPSAGLVSVTSGNAVLGTAGFAWTVSNQGTVESSSGDAIRLTSGGVISNGQSGSVGGLISGYSVGVEIDQQPGTLTNYGTIAATGTGTTEGVYLALTGTVQNLGTITATAGTNGIGIYLAGGGAVSNGQSGATGGLIAGSDGVVISGTAGSVANYGTIAGAGYGVLINTDGTVVNFGTIQSTAGGGVSLDVGGAVTNGVGGLITGCGGGVGIGGSIGTVVNLGTIEGTGTGSTAVGLEGGVVVNGQSGSTAGLINGGYFAIQIGNSAGTVVNFGTIAGTSGHDGAIGLDGGGIVVNYGTITGGPASGVYMNAGGFVTNGRSGSSAGLIAGSDGVNIGGGGAVTNYGTIDATAASYSNGVALAGGSVANFGTILATGSGGSEGVAIGGRGALVNGASRALILGYYAGVAIGGTGGRVVNFGTIASVATGRAGVFLDVGAAVGNAGTVTNYGTIEGGPGGVAIYTRAGASVRNAQGAVITGIEIARGVGNVDNLGTITTGIGLGSGGAVVNGQSGSTAGRITGSDNAIEIGASAGTVVNFGTLGGAGFNSGVVRLVAGGTVSNYGMIVGSPAVGVWMDTGGFVTNGRSGSAVGLIAGSDGVNIGGGGAVINYGTIDATAASYSDGVILDSGSVVNFGTILATGSGGSEGAAIGGGGILVNGQSGSVAGLILGYYTGVGIGSAGTVVNFGTIASVATGRAGVFLDAGTAGNAGTVANFGTIAGGPGGGAAIYTRGGASVSNAQGAMITGAGGGVDIARSSGTVVNFGTIEGTSTSAFQVTGVSLYGGSITNGGSGSAGALIEGVQYGAVIGGSAGTLTNFGTIGATGPDPHSAGLRLTTGGTIDNLGTIEGAGVGLFLDSGAVVTNGQSGSTTGLIRGATGLVMDGPGTVINYGMLTGTAASYAGGVYMPAGMVKNLGTILATGSGGSEGVAIGGGGILVNGQSGSAAGLILGYYAGVGIGSAGTVINFGTIASVATGRAGVLLNVGGTVANYGTIAGGPGGVGIYLRSGGNVTNRLGGVIIGAGSGVVISRAAGTAINYGTIVATGSYASAVDIRYGVFINLGLVEGAASGIELGGTIEIFGTMGTIGSLGTTASGLVTVLGTVVGTTGISTAPAATAGYTVTVGGTVMGTGGTAVALAGGTNRLIVDPGAAFTGVLNGGGGNSVLEIAASGSGSSGSGGAFGADGATAYVSLGSVVNFSLLQVDPSATVAASGVLSIPTLINQGQVNVGSGDRFAVGAVSAAGTGTIDLRTGGTVAFTGAVYNQTLYFHPPGGTALIEQPNEFHGTITDFSVGDTIDLTGFVASGESFANNTLVLTDTVSNSVTLDIQGSFSTGSFVTTSDGGTGTDVTIACFCRGTLILTETGEVAVEELAIGDTVVTVSGAARSIKWIGRRAYDGRFVAANRAVLPIRIDAGALAEGVPARDLLVSPEHALYIDGQLVPAGLLVNGATIRQVEGVERLEYFHIELETQEIIFAEGAGAETYVDCDNRLMFQNAAEFAAPYPDDAAAPWQFCAPRVAAGAPELATIRSALLQRAEALGHMLDLDLDPDLHLIVDGARIWPDSIAGDRYRFHVPVGSAPVWLASRSAVPAEIETGSRDHRRLGVPVERIVLFDAARSIEASHDDAALCEGFHADEDLQRWTDGLARLPEAWLRAFPGGATLDVRLVPTGLGYRVSAPVPERTAA